MNTAPQKIFPYSIYSKAFLKRAQRHLADFDNGEVGSFFYAALELRYGIERRLYEYIDASLKQLGQTDTEIKSYNATALLRDLTRFNPKQSHPLVLRITDDQSGAQAHLRYTPVSKRLAAIHGQLGEILHSKFFRNNPHWFLAELTTEASRNTLLDFRTLIAEGIDELAYATSGTLLSSPKFTQRVSNLNNLNED